MRNLAPITLFMALITATLLPSYAKAETTYRLKGDIDIKTETIALSDLIDGPSLPHDPMFAAPALGQTGTIQIARIAAALKKTTGQTLQATADTQIQVRRRARIISENDIAEALGRVIARDYKIKAPDIRLQFDHNETSIAAEEDAKGAIQISNMKFDPQSLRFEAQMTLADSASLITRPARLAGYVMGDRLVPVIARSIEKGASISVNDIRMERRLRSTLVGKTLVAMNDLVNRVALTSLNAGDVVSDDVVGYPLLIDKGAFVTVLYESNGLMLSMRGRANESGALGDVIAFTNPQSKKTLFGTVTAAGHLRVNAMPAREALLAPQPVTQAK